MLTLMLMRVEKKNKRINSLFNIILFFYSKHIIQ